MRISMARNFYKDEYCMSRENMRGNFTLKQVPSCTMYVL